MKLSFALILLVGQLHSLVDGAKTGEKSHGESEKGGGKEMSSSAKKKSSGKKMLRSDTRSLKDIPTNDDDFGEPAWLDIIEIAFPPWELEGGAPCGSVEAVGSTAINVPFPSRTEGGGKWNPCYYTKRFAGLEPSYGGYPTPVDTRYPYEFAAPFFGQPGDGSTHHCPRDSKADIDIGSCPKVDAGSVGKYGIGHIPPFVPLNAIKMAYMEDSSSVCSDWFDYNTSRCDIKKSIMDELVFKYFGTTEGKIVFPPPIIIDGEPSATYFLLEYGGESPACDAGNCRGPHYCSEDVADAGNIWGDFCPYVHTGPNSGKYRHPHIGLAALQQWMANQCMPDKCGTEWDEGFSPYPPAETVSTSITWCEMEDNESPWAQPLVAYAWPIETDGPLPGPNLYEGTKSAAGTYVNELVG
jgi:hypothetical protein